MAPFAGPVALLDQSRRLVPRRLRVGGEQVRGIAVQHLGQGPPVQALGTLVPVEDGTIEGRDINRIIGGVEQLRLFSDLRLGLPVRGGVDDHPVPDRGAVRQRTRR